MAIVPTQQQGVVPSGPAIRPWSEQPPGQQLSPEDLKSRIVHALQTAAQQRRMAMQPKVPSGGELRDPNALSAREQSNAPGWGTVRFMRQAGAMLHNAAVKQQQRNVQKAESDWEALSAGIETNNQALVNGILADPKKLKNMAKVFQMDWLNPKPTPHSIALANVSKKAGVRAQAKKNAFAQLFQKIRGNGQPQQTSPEEQARIKSMLPVTGAQEDPTKLAEAYKDVALGDKALQPPAPKSLTPEERAMNDLKSKVNPATGKPYTDEEALVKVKQDEQTVKPTKPAGIAEEVEDIKKKYPQYVAQIQPPDVKNYPGGEANQMYTKAVGAWAKQVNDRAQRDAVAAAAARGAAYVANREYQVLDTANGNRPVMVTGNVLNADQQSGNSRYILATSGQKALSQTAQMDDIVNASQNVREAVMANGNTPFTPSQVAKITLAMKETDPTVMRNEIADLAASGLSEPQMDLVTWLQQLQERALSLRSVAGMGQGSETTRMAILKALPGITSGSPQMALKQLDAFDNMVANLRKGVLNVSPAKSKKQPQNKVGSVTGAAPKTADEFLKKYSQP